MDEVTAAVNKAISSAIRNNPNLFAEECDLLTSNDKSADSKQGTSQVSSSYGDVRDLPTVQSDHSQVPQSHSTAVHQSRVLPFEIILILFNSSNILRGVFYDHKNDHNNLELIHDCIFGISVPVWNLFFVFGK